MLEKADQPWPLFLGDKEFHDGFKRTLLELKPEWYGKMGWRV